MQELKNEVAKIGLITGLKKEEVIKLNELSNKFDNFVDIDVEELSNFLSPLKAKRIKECINLIKNEDSVHLVQGSKFIKSSYDI